MAMNATTLATALASDLKSLWRSEGPSNEAQNEDYFLDQLALAISTRVIEHITNNARCNGTDSGGDSHSNVGIV